MLTIAGNQLSAAMKSAGLAAAAKSPLDVLTHIHLRGQPGGDTLEVTGSDGSQTVTATIAASIGPDAVDICLPADKLNAVAGMSSPTVSLARKGEKVVATAGTCKITMPALPGASYPRIKVEGAPTARFEAPGLTALIPTVAFAAAGPRVHDRPYLRNLWLESDGSAIHLVGCDSFMLAANCLPVATAEFGVPLSSDAADLLASVGAVEFEIYERHIVGRRPGITVTCIRPATQYFPWRRLIPAPGQYVTFRREELLRVCPLHRLFDKTGVVRFQQDGNVCSIAISDGQQSVDAYVAVTEWGEESHLEAAFNGPNLLSMLGQTKAETVSLSWQGDQSSGACLLQDGSWRGLLVPMRA
jgi:DNA polymerase III sliding clamp (beta) subunit (PCNA family)